MHNNYRYKTRFLKNRVIRRRGLSGVHILKLPAFFLVMGVLSGSAIFQISTNYNNEFVNYFVNEIINIYRLPFIGVMSYIYLTLIFTHVFIFLNGFSCLGAPFVLVAVFSNGLVYGLISGFLYTSMGAYGLVANLFVFLLPQIANSVLLLIFSSKSIKQSINLLKLMLLSKNDVPLKLNAFLKTFLYFCLAIFLSSVISASLAIVFVPVFF